jgi:hypothetical protein
MNEISVKESLTARGGSIYIGGQGGEGNVIILIMILSNCNIPSPLCFSLKMPSFLVVSVLRMNFHALFLFFRLMFPCHLFQLKVLQCLGELC